jgi:hypothetical protein
LPSRARCPGCGAGAQGGAGGVADLALEGAAGFGRGLALVEFALVAGVAVAVLVRDLGHCGHVDHVAVAPVAAHGQPEDLPASGRYLDRRGAVAGRELVRGREPGYVRGVAYHGRGDDRADAEDAGQAGAGDADRGIYLLAGIAPFGAGAVQVIQVLSGQVVPGLPGRAGCLVRVQDRGGTVRGDVLRPRRRE